MSIQNENGSNFAKRQISTLALARAKPRNREESRRWNFFNGQDNFYPIRIWPRPLQLLGMRQHLAYAERSQLWFFFVYNGLDPSLATDWVLHHGGYAPGDWRAFHTLEKNWTNYHYRYFDMDRGRLIQWGENNFNKNVFR